jgi:hypothetical protein
MKANGFVWRGRSGVLVGSGGLRPEAKENVGSCRNLHKYMLKTTPIYATPTTIHIKLLDISTEV